MSSAGRNKDQKSLPTPPTGKSIREWTEYPSVDRCSEGAEGQLHVTVKEVFKPSGLVSVWVAQKVINADEGSCGQLHGETLSDLGLRKRMVDTYNRLYFGVAPKSLQMVTAAMKLKDTCFLEEKLRPT